MSSTKSLISQSLLQYFNRLTDEGTNYIRPLVILICGMLLFNLPTVLYKIRLFLNGIMYLVLCFDKSWKKPTDPGSIFGPHLSQGLPVERKTIYFVRHAESTWNETFNVGSHRTLTQFLIGFIPGLIKSLLYEIHLLLSGKMDRYVCDFCVCIYECFMYAIILLVHIVLCIWKTLFPGGNETDCAKISSLSLSPEKSFNFCSGHCWHVLSLCLFACFS